MARHLVSWLASTASPASEAWIAAILPRLSAASPDVGRVCDPAAALSTPCVSLGEKRIAAIRFVSYVHFVANTTLSFGSFPQRA